MPTTPPRLTLVCPRKAKPGQTVYYNDSKGQKCATKVPPNVKPGQRFEVTQLFCGDPKEKEETMKTSHSTELLKAYNEKSGGKLGNSKSCPGLLKEMKQEDRDLLNAYMERQKKGGDENYWKAQGFRASGSPENMPTKSINGFGAPKWSPYYRSKNPDIQPKKKETLGDQAWWESYGFKGAMSDQKKRDYGNGVPIWSPYYRSNQQQPMKISVSTVYLIN